jgi:hypothetical protein
MKSFRNIAFAICLLALTAFADQTNYQSPIDGKIYQGDWRTYGPTNSPATNTPAGRVQMQGVRLLTSQKEFDRSLETSKLAEFIRKPNHRQPMLNPPTKIQQIAFEKMTSCLFMATNLLT